MLSLDVFSVLLLKRHGIYTVFEAFSTVNFIFLEALLERFWLHFRLFWGVPPGGPFGAIFGLILAPLGGLFGPMFSRIRPTADTNQPEPGPKPPESVSIRPDSAPTLPNSAQIPKPVTIPPESAPHQPKSTRIGHSGQTFSTQGA